MLFEIEATIDGRHDDECAACYGTGVAFGGSTEAVRSVVIEAPSAAAAVTWAQETWLPQFERPLGRGGKCRLLRWRFGVCDLVRVGPDGVGVRGAALFTLWDSIDGPALHASTSAAQFDAAGETADPDPRWEVALDD